MTFSTNPPPEALNLIEPRVKQIGQSIFEGSKRAKAKFYESGYWQSKLMELSTEDARVKTQLFRFVDVLPVLKTSEQKKEHLIEYLSPPSKSAAATWPIKLGWVSQLLKVPGLSSWLVSLSDAQVHSMGNLFIVGRRPAEAIPKLLEARARKIAFTLDILGEAVVSQEESEYYYQMYSEMIHRLGDESKKWDSVSPIDDSALGPIPKVNISIKVSALDCRMDPMAFEASCDRLIKRILPLMEAAIQKGVFINFDMEMFSLKELTREIFKRLLLLPSLKNYRHFGIVVQAYLKDAADDVKDWIDFAKVRGTPFTIRLVKGAYWDYETILAGQNGWPIPVWSKKFESDLCYEECTRLLLTAFPHIEVAIGSHNVRSIAHALAVAEELQLPPHAFEVQMLYGMAEPFKRSLIDQGIRLREYAPMGELLPGLSYLVRRLLENTSNDSFLKQSFLDKKEIIRLLQKPGEML